MTLLENDVSVLQDEVEELESDNSQQDDRFLIIEENVAGNSDDIDGKLSDYKAFSQQAKTGAKGKENYLRCLLLILWSFWLLLDF